MNGDINHYSCIFRVFDGSTYVFDFSGDTQLSVFAVFLDGTNHRTLASPSVTALMQDPADGLHYFQKPHTLELGGPTQVSYCVYSEVYVGKNHIFFI